MLFSASSSYSAEIFSSPNEKLALGTELTLEDFKGQTFFASSLRKEGKGMEVRVVFDGDGNVQSIALQASGSPAKGKVKEFDKKNLVVKASAAIGKNFNKTAITIDLKQLLFKHAYTSETGASSRHHSGTLIDSRLGCFNRLKKQKRLGCSDAQVADFAKKYNFSQPSGDRWNTTRVFDELIKPAILDYSEENPPSSKITAKLDIKNTAVTAESEEVKTEPVSPEKTEVTTTTNNSDQFTKLQLRVSSYLADIKVFLARNPDLPNLLEVLTAVSEVKTELSGKSEQDLNEAFASLEKSLSNNQDFSNFVTALKAQRQEKLDQAVRTAQALLKKYTAFLRKLITLNMVDNTDLAMALVPISKSIEEQQNSADPKALNSLIEDTNGQLAKLGLAEAFAKELQKSAGASDSKTTNNKKQHGAINTGGAENAYHPATIEEFIEFSGAWRSTNDLPNNERFQSAAIFTFDGPKMAEKWNGQYSWDGESIWVFPEDLGKESWFGATGLEIGWPKVQPKISDVMGFDDSGFQLLKPDFKIPYPVADLRKEVSEVSPLRWFWNADTSVNSDAVVRSEDTFYEYRPDGEKYPGMGKCTLSYSKYINIRERENSKGRVVEKWAEALRHTSKGYRFSSNCLYVLPNRKQGEPDIALLVPDPKLMENWQPPIHGNYLKNPYFFIFYKLGDGHDHESENVPAMELADWPNIRKFVKARWEALYPSFKLPEQFLSDQNTRILMYIFGLDKWSAEKRPVKTLFVKQWKWLEFCIDDPKYKDCNILAERIPRAWRSSIRNPDEYQSAWTLAESLIWNIDLIPLKEEVYKYWNPQLKSAMKKRDSVDKYQHKSDKLADLHCGKGKADEVSQVLNYITWAEDFGDSPKCTTFWYPEDKQNCVYKKRGGSVASAFLIKGKDGHQTLTLNDYDPKSLSLEPKDVDTSEVTLDLRPWTTIIQLKHAGETLISSDPLREKQPEIRRIQRGLSLIYNGKNCQGTSKAF